MRDILPEIDAWVAEGTPFALATVVRTWGSSPRQPGAAMAVREDLRVAGSVSGGCIEGAVIEEAKDVLATGIPRTVTFGVSDDSAWSVGLTCGGKVKVLVERCPAFDPDPAERAVWTAWRAALRENRPVVLLAQMAATRPAHLLVDPTGPVTGDRGGWTAAAVAAARAAYATRDSGEVDVDGKAVFAHVFPRRDQLLVVGAAHIALGLVRLGHQLGFETVVIDPRRIFADRVRFPVPPDRLLDGWPQETLPSVDLTDDTYAVLLTHDPKIDDPATHILLRSPVAYIGALGSKRTQQKRRERLLKAGFSEDDLARIRGPIGLPIHACTPDEIALAIMAEVVQTKNARRQRV